MGLAQQGQPETITVAGLTVSLSKVKVVHYMCNGGNYITMRYNGAPYQVPTGKTARFLAAKCANESSSVSACCRYLHYGDSAVSDSASPPTNIVDINPTGCSSYYTPFFVAAFGVAEFLTYFSVPSGKYPCVHGGAPSLDGGYFIVVEE